MQSKTVDKFKNRVNDLDNESGMEAAQVILILVLVTIALIPMLKFLQSKITERGSGVGGSIGNVTPTP